MTKKVIGDINFFDESGDIIDRISHEQMNVDKIKAETDFLKLLSHFGIEIKKSGKNLMTNCPFHEDKNPSFSVLPDEKGFKCFGCGKSGDLIRFVEYYKGIKFKEALKFLTEFNNGGCKPADLPVPEKKTVDSGQKETKNEKEVDLNLELGFTPEEVNETEFTDQDKQTAIFQEISLTVVAGHYHKTLFKNTNARMYLESRGIKTPAVISRFKLGYCDGNILNLIGKSQAEALKKLTILSGSDHTYEYFKGYITAPIFDEADQAVGIYGRSIDPASKIPHLYLKGKHKSVFNRKASKVYDEIILTESIIDALSLIELGIENVQAIYGVNGFTAEHLEILKSDRVKTVILGFDKDEAGIKASESIKEKLLTEGFKVKVITPSVCKDWNEELINSITKDQVKALIDNALLFEPKEVKEPFEVKKDREVYHFKIDDITYRLSGVKEVFVNDLKVHIRIQTDEENYHHDRVDLIVYRSRLKLSSDTAGKLGVNAVKVEKDLDRILLYLEKERDRKLSAGKPQEEPELTDEEIEIGMAFLKSPDLIDKTVADITLLGYAGENNNKLMVYVIGLSRFMPKPLSGFVLATAGTGKTCLVDMTIRLFPPERLKFNASLSDQAFHYMSEEEFDGNIFIMGESLHNPIVEGYIRQMQTENKISRAVVRKDEKTGEMKTIHITHDVRLVFLTTSTKLDINLENVSRCILIKIDESKNQTDAVLEKQREGEYDLDTLIEQQYTASTIIKKHIVSQKLLKPVNIYIPYAKHIRFPSYLPIFRRTQPYFLIVIKVICFWRQYQKTPVLKVNPHTKQAEEWYPCDLYDYEVARRLFIECRILSEMDDISGRMVFLYEKIREMVRAKADLENVSPVEIDFIQSEVRELEGIGMGNVSIKRYIRKLVDFEYLQIVGGKRHGTQFSYKLREDKPIQKIDASAVIPTAEEIKKLMDNDRDR